MTTTTTLPPARPSDAPRPSEALGAPLPPPPAYDGELRRALARLASVQHPHLAALRSVGLDVDGFVLGHDVTPAAVSWAELVSRRRATITEAVTMARAVAGALGALHDADLAHGAVDAAAVKVAPDGVIVLDGCGAAWTAAPGRSGRDGVGPLAADDVRELAVLLGDCLDPGSVESDLALLLIRAEDPDPAVRPSVHELASSLDQLAAHSVSPAVLDPAAFTEQSAGTATPVESPDRLVAVASGSDDRVAATAPASVRVEGPRRPRRFKRRTVIVLVLLGLVLVCLRAAVTSMRHPLAAPGVASASATGPPEHSASPAAPPSVDEWGSVIRRLDAVRAGALAASAPSRLLVADDPSGPAYATDLSALRARAGAVVTGGALQVRAVRELTRTTTRVVLEVSDVRSAYVMRDRAGAVVASGPVRPLTVWRVELSRGPGEAPGWRIYDVGLG